MIISRTPFRISFFGGGTDFERWYSKNGGAFLSTTIDKYCFINCRYFPSFFSYKNRIVWSKIETVNNIEEISHPAVREIMKWKKIDNLSIHHEGDLPAKTGLGSSSSFTVGLLNAIAKLKGENLTKEQLIRDTIFVERNLLKEAVGIQDQIAVTLGGINRVKIEKNGEFKVFKFNMPLERRELFENKLMMFYTGISRYSSKITSNTISEMHKHEPKYFRLLEMVEKGSEILLDNKELDDFGDLLNEAWHIKKQLSSKISSTFIDQVYERGIKAGALGGKLLGAGGGGFIIFYVNEEYQEKVKNELQEFIHIKFKFEEEGTTVIYDNSLE